VGACFVAMLKDDQLGDSSLRIWREHMSRIAPNELTDRRRAALKSVFGLDVQVGALPPAWRPPPRFFLQKDVQIGGTL